MSIITRYDYKTHTEVAIPGLEDLEPVFLEDEGGYEWTAMGAWYSPSQRRFFWVQDSGCSCNSFGDGVRSVEDFQNGSKADLLAASDSFLIIESYGGFTQSSRDRALAAVRDFVETDTIVVYEATRDVAPIAELTA